MVIEISNSTIKWIIIYLCSQFATSVPSNGIFAASAFNLRSNQLGAILIENTDNSCDSGTFVINRGERILLTINALCYVYCLEERCDVWGVIIPEEGAASVVIFHSLSVLYDILFDNYIKD